MTATEKKMRQTPIARRQVALYILIVLLYLLDALEKIIVVATRPALARSDLDNAMLRAISLTHLVQATTSGCASNLSLIR